MAAATITLAACTDEDDSIASQSTPLQVQTTLTQARSVITDTAFGDGQSIGITLVHNTTETTAYEGKTEGYTNVPYTSSGTGNSQTWSAQNPIMLSPTVGKAVAYYPYAQTNADYKAIPVTAQGQTDYMYSGWTDADGISNADAKATFVMQHALSAIRITVKKGSYSQTGSLSAISLTSDGFGVSGTLNAATGALAGVAAAEVNSTMNPDFATANITAEGLSNILMVAPTGVAEAKPITVTVTIDGKQYAAQANMTEPVAQGKIYSVALLLDNKTFEVTEVDITPWNEKQPVDGGTLEAYDPYSSMTAIFEVDDVSTPTRLLGEWFSIAQMHSMVIDGQEAQPTRTYTFPEPGIHTVRYQFEPGKLTNMYNMFTGCENMKSLNVKKCNTSNVTNLVAAFSSCVKLELLDLSTLDTSNMTDISNAFNGCSNLKYLNLEGWDTSNVTTMAEMFRYCPLLSNLDVSHFNTSNVTDMHMMFDGCKSLNKIDVSKWNTSKCKAFNAMFWGCENLTSIDVSGWDTSAAEHIGGIFDQCIRLAEIKGVEDWNVSNVKYMETVFKKCPIKSMDISKWKVEKVERSYGMFSGCNALEELNVKNLNFIANKDYSDMFNGCKALQKLDFTGWNTVSAVNMKGMFQSCFNLTELDVRHFKTSNVTDMSYMFGGLWNVKELDLTGFDTSNVTNMEGMLEGLWKVEKIDVSSFNTSNVTTMESMFSYCEVVSSLDIAHFNTAKVTNMKGMFDHCYKLEGLDLSSWNTSNVTNMCAMFWHCRGMKDSSFKYQDLNVSNVTNMKQIFMQMDGIAEFDLTKWNIQPGTDMSSMFNQNYACKTIRFKSDVSTCKVDNMFQFVSGARTLYYNAAYDYSNIIAQLPANSTAVPVNY